MSAPPDQYLEFTSHAGNVSFVRKADITAIYHDGTTTRITLGSGVVLLAGEMPATLIERMTAKPRTA